MNQDLLNKIDQEIVNCRNALAQDTIKLIQIDSTQQTPAPGAPFGMGPKKVLDTVLEMGKAEGFHSTDYGVGVASLGLKEGQPDLGIWLHGDVVPVDNDWIYPPFAGTMYKDTHIIGRGATDNKGQLAAIFHLLKIFKSLGIALKYNPALYVGCNEETGMADVQAFLKRHTPPKLSLIPDSSFPIGYGGKGGMNLTFRSKKPLHKLTITAGLDDAPGKAEANLNGKAFAAETPPRHTSNPDPGGNMITRLAEQLLTDENLSKEDCSVVEFCKEISLDINGKKFDVWRESQQMKPMTIFAKTIRTLDGHLNLTVNIRYPIENSAEQIADGLKKAAGDHGMELVETKTGTKPFLLDKDQPLVQALAAIANEVTGDSKAPYTLSGSAYCSYLPNAYAYGMDGNQIPEDFPKGHGGAHGKDEIVSLDRLQTAMRIYGRALLALNEMDW